MNSLQPKACHTPSALPSSDLTMEFGKFWVFWCKHLYMFFFIGLFFWTFVGLALFYFLNPQEHQLGGAAAFFVLTIATIISIFAWRFTQVVTQLVRKAERFAEAKNSAEDLSQKLVISEARSLGILRILQDGVVHIDEHGIIRIVNDAITRKFGYHEEELIGHNVSILMPEPNRSAHDGYLTHYLSSRECNILNRRVTVEGLRKDGSLFPIELAVIEMVDDTGITFIATIRDITEQIAEKEKLENALASAEEATIAKENFLAKMSHEIRTPINAVLGFSQLCLLLDLPIRGRDYVEKIHSAANSLLGIINNILDFSKIKAGKMEMESIPFSLSAVLDQLNNLFSTKVQGKVGFVIERQQGIPNQLIGDPLRLGQVLTNLIGNAHKFTASGAVKLQVTSIEINADTATLKFEVHDSGIGMTPEHLSTLFTAFTQADNSTTRKYGGSGLGLAICKELVENMGGEIKVKSEIGLGSSFYFSVRFAISTEKNGETITPPYKDEAAVIPRVSRLSAPDLRSVHILLVDDNEFNRQVGSELIQISGAKVDVVNDGKQAVDAVTTGAYNLVLMDIQMPVMDGYTAAQIIRQSHPNLPIIALTAHALNEERKRVLDCGMNDIITKPIVPDVLFATLVHHLKTDIKQTPLRRISPERRKITDRRNVADEDSGRYSAALINLSLKVDKPQFDETLNTSQSIEMSLNSPATLDGIDLAGALGRVNGDQKLLKHFMNLFRQHNYSKLDEVRDALAQRDITLAKRIAHSIKGGAGTLGAVEVQECASQLEMTVVKEDWVQANVDLIKLDVAWTRMQASLVLFLDTTS